MSEKTKHLSLGFIYGLISLICFLGTDMSTVLFDSVMVLISWIALIAMIYSIQWFDYTTDGYFIITILLFMAARLARYNGLTIAKPASYIAIGVGLGLVVQSIINHKGWAAIWLLSIFAIEICTLELDTKWQADLTGYFPPIDFIDSKFTLDPTTITDWDITPSLF